MNNLAQTHQLPTGWVEARYRKSEIPELQGNPYAEAIPPLKDFVTWARVLARRPRFDPLERSAPEHVRAVYVRRLSGYFEPLTRHMQLATEVHAMLLNGYIGRNPCTPDFTVQLQSNYDAVQAGSSLALPPTLERIVTGLTLLGPSGSGKTTSLNGVLSQFPQCIYHPGIHKYQVVYLKVDFPYLVSPDELAVALHDELRRRAPPGTIPPLPKNKRKASYVLPLYVHYSHLLGVGVLLIEEMQNVSGEKVGGRIPVLNFIQNLANQTGIPTVYTGTLDVLELLSSSLRTARRSSSSGDLIWPRLPREAGKGRDNCDGPTPAGAEFKHLLKGLLRYQWSTEVVELTPELTEVFYDETQGIIALLVTLYMLCQLEIIRLEGTPGTKRTALTLDAALVRRVSRARMRLVQRLVKAYREGDEDLAFALEREMRGPRMMQRLQEAIDRHQARIPVVEGREQDDDSFALPPEQQKAISILELAGYSRITAIERVTSLSTELKAMDAGQIARLVLTPGEPATV